MKQMLIEDRIAPTVNCRYRIRCWRFIQFIAVAAGGIAFSFGQLAADEDDIRDGLNSGAFPWYDSVNDDVHSVDLPPGQRAETLNREGIDEYDPDPNLSNTPTQNTRPGSVAGAGAMGNVFLFVVAGILALLIIGCVVWAFLGMSDSSKKSKSDDRPIEFTPERIEALPPDLQQAAAEGDLLALARQSYQRGDFRMAAIYLYSHVLLSLDHFGWIRLHRGKTNRQYLKEIAGDREMRLFFEPLMVGFEKAFFGKYELSNNDLAASWNSIDSFQEKVKTSPSHQNKRIAVAT